MNIYNSNNNLKYFYRPQLEVGTTPTDWVPGSKKNSSSEIKQTADEITQTVKGMVRNVNYLKGLEDGSGWTDYESFKPQYLQSFCVFLCENGMNVTSPIVELPAGTYTASAHGWDNESQITGITLFVLYIDSQGIERSIGYNRTTDIQGGLMKYTFTLLEAKKVFLRFAEDNDEPFCISEPKIEAGTEVTEWESSTMSQIKQTADEIEALVEDTGVDITHGKINLYADKVKFYKNKASAQAGDTAKIWIDGTDGSLHAVDGNFSGKVTASDGEIGGFKISSNEIKSQVAADKSLTMNKDGSFAIVNGSNSVKMNTNGFEVMFGGEGFRVGDFGTGHQGMERWDSTRNVWAAMYERKIAKVFKATTINLGSSENKSVNYVLNARVDWDNHTNIYLPSSSDVPNGTSIIVRGLARDCDAYVFPKQGSADVILAGDYKRESIEVLAADCAEFILCKGIKTNIRRTEFEQNPSVYIEDAWLCNMYDRDV